MSPRFKWGLIAGAGVAVLNLCGGMLMGVFNNCLSVITVTLAAAAAGYFCGRQEKAGEAVRAGAIAGTLVGFINLASQLVGGTLGGLIGAGFLSAFSQSSSSDPTTWLKGVGVGFGLIIVLALVFGAALIFLGAGVGALAAKLALPAGQPAD